MLVAKHFYVLEFKNCVVNLDKPGNTNFKKKKKNVLYVGDDFAFLSSYDFFPKFTKFIFQFILVFFQLLATSFNLFGL